MGDLIQNIHFLKSIGIHQWLLCDERFQNFLSWLSNNATNDNLLNDLEFQEYDDICKNKKLLQNDDLNKELTDLEAKYENFFTYTENDVKQLERKLEDLIAVEEMYENLMSDVEPLNSNIIKDLSKLDIERNRLKDNEESHGNACIELAKTLQSLEMQNQKTFTEINQCYLSNTNNNLPIFMYQMPFDQYFQKYESFINCLTVYLQKYFKNSPNLNSKHNEMIKELDIIKERLYQMEMIVLDDKMQNFGQRKLIKNLNVNTWNIQSISELQDITNDLTIRNETLDTMKKNGLANLESCVQRYVEQEIEMIIYENNKEKLKRAQERNERVNKIYKLISNDLMNAEILWTLLQIDLIKARERNEYDTIIDSKYIESQLNFKRLQLMDTIIRSPCECDVYNLFVKKLSNVMFLKKPNEYPDNLQLCISEYNQLNRIFENYITINLDQKHFEYIKGIMGGINSLDANFKKYLNDGPVNKPNYTNLKFYELIFTIKKDKEGMDLRLSKLKNDYRNFKQHSATNTLWRYEQKLWIYFLTEPKKVIRCIDTIVQEAKSLSDKHSNKQKPIGGLKRKT